MTDPPLQKLFNEFASQYPAAANFVLVVGIVAGCALLFGLPVLGLWFSYTQSRRRMAPFIAARGMTPIRSAMSRFPDIRTVGNAVHGGAGTVHGCYAEAHCGPVARHRGVLAVGLLWPHPIAQLGTPCGLGENINFMAPPPKPEERKTFVPIGNACDIQRFFGSELVEQLHHFPPQIMRLTFDGQGAVLWFRDSGPNPAVFDSAFQLCSMLFRNATR